MIPTWFLYLTGFSMTLLGIMQIQARPHEKGDGFFKRFVNVGTLWSICCIVIGALLVLVALGYIPQPGGQAPAPPSPSRRSRQPVR